MDGKKVGMMTGVVAAVGAGIGMILPFFTMNLGIASSAGTFFDADPAWFETLWAFAGIVMILLGAVMRSRAVLALGGLVTTSMSVYLIYCMNQVSGIISPSTGFYFYLAGGLAALGGAILIKDNGAASEESVQSRIG